ncbi:MAG: hypothetical protein JNL58_30200 [Planctomyces sp.]|nr:hypothetical protein [Planctomyces sp.]
MKAIDALKGPPKFCALEPRQPIVPPDLPLVLVLSETVLVLEKRLVNERARRES